MVREPSPLALIGPAVLVKKIFENGGQWTMAIL